MYTPGLIIALMYRIDELPEVNLVYIGRTVDNLEKVYMTSAHEVCTWNYDNLQTHGGCFFRLVVVQINIWE